MLRGRKVPPFFKLTLVVLCAYILWTFNHPHSDLPIGSRYARSAESFIRSNVKGQESGKASSNAKFKRESVFRKVDDECSNAATNVAFLKTHKTGSSTMSNIMLRFADTHNLTVGLPLKDHWELGGYPAYIDKRLIDPPLQKYNILGHHFRFNIDNLQKIMPEDTRYITIIRSPVDNVESVFGFFQDQNPFIDWLEGVEPDTALRLNMFYNDPTKYYNEHTDWFFRARNHMFFDIGYDVTNEDDAYIESKIKEMDNTFTLVLLTDFFDESLIMMKHLLCWSWDDIIYIKFKMRIDEAKTEVNSDLARSILNWNKADARLYDYFNSSFWRRVDAYGKGKMADDLSVFQQKQKEAENLCIDSYQPFKKKPWILGAKLRKKPSPYCRNLAASETVYGEKLREKMYSTIDSLKELDEKMSAERNELFNKVAKESLQKT